MKKLNLLAILSLSFVTVFIGSTILSTDVSAVAAINSNNGQALEIAPPVMNLTANPGQTITAQVSLRDISGGKLVVTGEINDFIAGGEDGTPKIILDNTTESPYSIKNWISPLPELRLDPKQIKNLPITITVPANAAPGGYYGTIRFTGVPPELKGTGVSLSASLGALILLRVNGTAKENLSIQEFSVNNNRGGKANTIFEAAPLQFVVRLKNNGNIHEQPVGQIAITDMFNKKIAAMNVNLSSKNVLPSSIREFNQTLDKSVIGNRILFGRYTAKLNMTYGSNKEVITKTISFWVIPYTMIAIGIAVLIAGFIGLKTLIKRYNSFIINKAQKTKSKSKKRK